MSNGLLRASFTRHDGVPQPLPRLLLSIRNSALT